MAVGATWAIKRDSRTYFVWVRRTGVEPSGGCLLGFPIWIVTRLRWEISSDRSWSVEVANPFNIRHPLQVHSKRRLLHEVFDTEDAAMAAAAEIAARVEAGEIN